MPFSIVHSDITQMRVDAIVNPTDSRFSGSGGVDLAIHQAAGPDLAQDCRQLPGLHPSQVAVTKAYGLPCKFVIHTVGPVWKGGWANEPALLRGCYLNALLRAAELGAESVAFPLISAGTFGFPKDRVLSVAAEAIRDFLSLRDEDMQVFLCVYDRNAYRVNRRGELERFLDSTRMKPLGKAMSMPEGRSRRFAMPQAVESAACEEAMPCEAPAPQSLEDWLKHQDDTFAVTLLKLIDKKHITEVQCYKRANVSKKTFWKINNDPKYKPSKPTVLAFAIALELSLPETEDLLRTVGFSLSHSSTFDMIIEFYIRQGIYDIYEINAALYQFDQVCLGC